MKPFIPDRVYFEPSAMNTPLAQKVQHYCESNNIPMLQTTSHNQVRDLPGENEQQQFAAAKKTLIIGTKKNMKLEVCKPSADFSFSLVTNCAGMCEYCYLYSTQGKKPSMRVYVNLDEIFETLDKTIRERLPLTTTFELASAGDPLSVEHITGTVAHTIERFGQMDHTHLRLVTKFDNVDGLLSLAHNQHTTIRFSLNAPYVLNTFEHRTAPLHERLIAAKKIALAGYPFGFILAPLMIFPNHEQEYRQMFEDMAEILQDVKHLPMTFELIQHRFTSAAKNVILTHYPNTKLDLDPELRTKKFGKYGIVKYIYPKEQAKALEDLMRELVASHFPQAQVLYFT